MAQWLVGAGYGRIQIDYIFNRVFEMLQQCQSMDLPRLNTLSIVHVLIELDWR